MERPAKPVRAKLEDVARSAGVSITTASLVLGEKGAKHRISEEVLQRVRHAAVELDYSPNRLVRSMQRGSTYILSFYNGFRHRGLHDLYMDTLSTAIEKAGGKFGYDILVNCDFSRSTEETYKHLNGGLVDGILFFAPLPSDPLLPYLRSSRLPTVLLNFQDEQAVLPSVKDDVASGMKQIAEKLVALGHRQIGVVIEPSFANPDARERIELLRHYLGGYGITIAEQNVLPYEEDFRSRLCECLAGTEPPTALFCWRDRLAYYVLESCEATGIDVPGELSVIGYDGLRWPAATRHTAASVSVSMEALAEAAITLLLSYIANPGQPVIQQHIPVVLTDGTTLAPPASSDTRSIQ